MKPCIGGRRPTSPTGSRSRDERFSPSSPCGDPPPRPIPEAAAPAGSLRKVTSGCTPPERSSRGLAMLTVRARPSTVFAVQRVDGLLGFFGRAHGDETKAARTAGLAVHHQVGFQ